MSAYPKLSFDKLSQELAEKIAIETGLLAAIIGDADPYKDYSNNLCRMTKELREHFSDHVEKWPSNDVERRILDNFNRIDWHEIVVRNFDARAFIDERNELKLYRGR